jgi:hypothetical protein
MKVPGSDGLNIEMSRYAWKEPTQKWLDCPEADDEEPSPRRRDGR